MGILGAGLYAENEFEQSRGRSSNTHLRGLQGVDFGYVYRIGPSCRRKGRGTNPQMELGNGRRGFAESGAVLGLDKTHTRMILEEKVVVGGRLWSGRQIVQQ